MSATTPKENDPHLPYVYQVDDRVLITIKHPKGEEHHIYKTNLEKNEEPTAIYILQKDEFIFNVYLYCNIHGLFRD